MKPCDACSTQYMKNAANATVPTTIPTTISAVRTTRP